MDEQAFIQSPEMLIYMAPCGGSEAATSWCLVMSSNTAIWISSTFQDNTLGISDLIADVCCNIPFDVQPINVD